MSKIRFCSSTVAARILFGPRAKVCAEASSPAVSYPLLVFPLVNVGICCRHPLSRLGLLEDSILYIRMFAKLVNFSKNCFSKASLEI